VRRLEILLCAANGVALLMLAVRIRGRASWMRHSALCALPTSGAQVLIEGPRWQMIPAYALSGVLLIVWLARSTRLAGGPSGRRWTKRLAAILGVGSGVLGLAISVALPIIVPVFGFPHPTGPYGIGTVTYHWIDRQRDELFTADPDDHREVMVQIWYPAKKDPSARRAPYVQDAGALAPPLAKAFHLPTFAFDHFKYVSTNAISSAPVATDEPSYPVLIFLHGFSGFRQHNTFQVEELVSHGYIVAAIDQPYAAASVVFPDGRQAVGLSRDQMSPLVRASYAPAEIVPALNGQMLPEGIVPYLAQDVGFTLDQLAALNQADPARILTGRLNLRHAGVFGVSLGAIVGAEACRTELRLQACLMMDAPMPTNVVKAGLRRPTMWITRDAETMRLEGWPQTEIDEHHNSMRATFTSLSAQGYFVQVRGMFHINLTDLPLVSPLLPRLGVSGPIDMRRAHDIVNAYSLAFFDRHLRSRPTVLLDGPAEQYPEVLFETH